MDVSKLILVFEHNLNQHLHILTINDIIEMYDKWGLSVAGNNPEYKILGPIKLV